LIGLRPRQRAHNEVEIGCGKPRPTIRSDHRDFIMRDPAPVASKITSAACIVGTRHLVSAPRGLLSLPAHERDLAKSPSVCLAGASSSTCARSGSSLTISG
jgi:hypothetical protein